MRISDWSSDVCSSDLSPSDAWLSRWSGARFNHVPTSGAKCFEWSSRNDEAPTTNTSVAGSAMAATSGTSVLPTAADRKSVEEGKSGEARVEPGERRVMKTQTT